LKLSLADRLAARETRIDRRKVEEEYMKMKSDDEGNVSDSSQFGKKRKRSAAKKSKKAQKTKQRSSKRRRSDDSMTETSDDDEGSIDFEQSNTPPNIEVIEVEAEAQGIMGTIAGESWVFKCSCGVTGTNFDGIST
jgi:ATPase subunit of ABC transporter with duplicated ATPase domains